MIIVKKFTKIIQKVSNKTKIKTIHLSLHMEEGMWSPLQVGYVKCNGDAGFLDRRSAPRLVCIYKTILDHLLFMANIDHILFYLPIVEGKSFHVFKHLNDSTNFNVSFVKRQENIMVIFFG